MVETITASILSGGIVSAVLLWLLRSWISERLKNSIRYEYDQKLESHKSQIRYESERELEHIRSQLQIDAERRSIQYSKIFTDIAETVAATYERLVKAKESVGSYVTMIELAGEPDKKEKRVIAYKDLQEFYEYFKIKKIYLPKETADKVEAFTSGLRDITFDFMRGVEGGRDERMQENGKDVDTWQRAHTYMTEEIPPVLNALEEEFRSILGVSHPSKPTEQGVPADR